MLAPFIAAMGRVDPNAIKYVGGKTDSAVNSASAWTTALTGLTGGISNVPSVDDFVLVFLANAGTSDLDLTATGFTEITELYANSAGADTNFAAFYKFMSGSVDASIEFSAPGTGNGAAVAVSVWRGVNVSTPMDVAATTATGTTDAMPNPASITPTTPDSVIVAGGGAAANVSVSVATSSELTDFVSTRTDTTTNEVSVGAGYLRWTSGAFNPATFGGTNNGTGSWAAITVALRPA